jgi:polysaccharide export outer membrane protein
MLFNAPNFTTSTTASSSFSVSQTTGYLVDQEGNIQFPVLGAVHAAGLTKKQLTNLITKGLLDRKQLVDPIVNVRFLNYRVTVLGEVARPSVLNIPNEKISLLEAIGLAGDLTIYAKRDNVMVIREVNGKKLIKRLNLNSTELLTSPYYYLQSNDIVYVEPNKARVASSERSQQLLPIVLSALSFVAIIVSYWRKN